MPEAAKERGTPGSAPPTTSPLWKRQSPHLPREPSVVSGKCFDICSLGRTSVHFPDIKTQEAERCLLGPQPPALSEYATADCPDLPWSFSSFLQEASNKERTGMLPCFPVRSHHCLGRAEPSLDHPASLMNGALKRKTLPRRCEEGTAQSTAWDLGQT